MIEDCCKDGCISVLLGCFLGLGLLLILTKWKQLWREYLTRLSCREDATDSSMDKENFKLPPGLQPADEKSGNLRDIADAGSLQEFLVALHQKFGPVASFHFGAKYAVSIMSPEHFRKQFKVFDRPAELFELFLPLIGEGSIQFCNGERGKMRHAVYRRCFSDENIGNLFSVFKEHSENLVKKWTALEAEELINLRHEMFHFAIRVILQTAFGTFFEDEEKIQSLRHSYDVCWSEMENRLKGDIIQPGSDRITHFEKHKTILYELLYEAVNYRRKQRSENDNLPELFVDVQEELALSYEDRQSDMLSILLAGFHTTGLALTWAMYFLAKHQHVQEKLYQELVAVVGDFPLTKKNMASLQYLRQVFEETLRCSKLVVFASRYQDTDVELGSYTIPANTAVIHALGVASQNPQFFPEPQRFDPDRFSPENSASLPNLAFQPFGFAGKRRCPGYKLSEAETKYLLATLIRSFKIELAMDEEVRMIYGLVTSPDVDIWITVSARL